MNWLDYSILALILISTLIGAVRGAIREVLGLGTWVLAFWVAWMGLDSATRWLAPHVSDPTLQVAVAFGAIFLLTLLVGGLLTALLASAVRDSRFSSADRTLGGGIGLLRGLFLVTAAVLVAELSTTLPESPAWRESFLVPRFEVLAQGLQTVVPERWLHALRDSSQASAVS